MKILLHAYNTYCQNSNGGVQIRLNKLKSLLEKRGFVCEYFSPSSTKLEDYDILHIFTTNAENYGLVKAAKEKGCKIVISSTLNLWDSNKIWFYTHFLNKLPILNVYKMSKAILDEADVVITETNKEKAFISHNYCVSQKKLFVIPNGIDPLVGADNSIYKYIPKDKPYALSVGRFDKNKNQLNLIKATRNSDITMVFIGGAHFSETGKEYFRKCEEAAKGSKNIILLGWTGTESTLLKSAYANAELLVCPSFHETFGMVLLEGGISGCKLAISNTLPILDYSCFDGCITFDPKSPKDIKEKVEIAFRRPKDSNLKGKIESTFSWEQVIDEHIKLYEEIIRKC